MMHTKCHLTLADAVVAACSVLVLLAGLGAVGNTSRERTKREVCLNNLRLLTDAWEAYALEHDGQLPNGSQGFAKTEKGCATGGQVSWPPWVGNSFNLQLYIAQCDVDAQLAMLKGPNEVTQVTLKANGLTVNITGTNQLYKYCPDLKVFRCPTASGCEMLSYSIVDAMAGGATWNSQACGAASPTLGPPFLNISEISNPSGRFVFVDEGSITPDSWTVNYDRPEWWDAVPGRHDIGTTFSFADGHAEFRKWTDPCTIELAKLGVYPNDVPPDLACQPHNADLQWVQLHAWGQLGYDPNTYTCP